MPSITKQEYSLDKRVRLLRASLLGLIIALWCLPLGRSLWLDETVTFWVSSGSFRDAVARTQNYQNHSALFYYIEWLWLRFAAPHEILIRLPAFLFALLSATIFYRALARHWNREGAALATLIFVSLENVIRAATNARPYSLPLLGCIVATELLYRWHKDRSAILLVGYVAALTLTVYAHFLFAIFFAVHACIVFGSGRTGWLKSAGTMAGVLGAAGALCLPLLSQMMHLTANAPLLSFRQMPTLGDLLASWLPYDFGAYSIAGLLCFFAWREYRRGRRFDLGAIPHVWLLLAWLVLPILLLFGASHLGLGTAFYQRYQTPITPAIALWWGIVLMWLPRKPRCVLLAPLMLYLVTQSGSQANHIEDWRTAIAQAQDHSSPGCPLLLSSGLVEGSSVPWLMNDENHDYLTAPVSYYSYRAGPVLPLPFWISSPEHQAFIRTTLDMIPPGCNRIPVLVCLPNTEILNFIESELAPRGTIVERIPVPGSIELGVLEMGKAAPTTR